MNEIVVSSTVVSSIVVSSTAMFQIQWNFSNPNFQGTDRFVRIREVFELGKFLFKMTKISKFPNSKFPNSE